MTRSVKKHEWTPEQERLVRETHAQLRCGPGKLVKALPDLDPNLVRAMVARLGLGAEKYHVWTDDEVRRLIELHQEHGFGGRRLVAEFPGIEASAINSKLSALRAEGLLPRPERKSAPKYTNRQHREFREFVLANRRTYRIPELTRRWNEVAAQAGIPAASEDMVRYWTRRKPGKNGAQTYAAGDFARADTAARQRATLKHRRAFEAEAAKAHEAAKAQASNILAADASVAKGFCRWCEHEFPLSAEFFKMLKGAPQDGICIWCRGRQRRDYHHAKLQGQAALAEYHRRMKAEKRRRFYDARWSSIVQERLALRDTLRKKKHPEQVCIKCEDSLPLCEPFFRAPGKKGKNYSRLCCFCDHEFSIRYTRGKADGKPTAPILQERKALLLRAFREEREKRVADLRRLARSVKGKREVCKDCGNPWPILEAHIRTFWRCEGAASLKRRRCLPCDWQKDAARREER